MADMKNLIIGNNTYNIYDDEAFRVSGDGREGSCLYVGTSSPYTPNLQLKRQNASMLNLSVQDDGYLKLQNVPYVSGEDDWNNATTLWDVDMTKVPSVQFASTSKSYKNTGTGWENIGISFTIPSGYIYLVTVYAGWASGTPSGVGIHDGATLSGTNPPRWASAVASSQGSPAFLLTTATTYTCWVKRGTANATNTNYVSLLKLKTASTTF